MTGLCHGPGCCNPQTVPFWCSERCQMAWDARWGKRLPDEGLSDEGMGGLLREAFRTAADQVLVDQAITAQLGTPTENAMVNLAEALRQIVPGEPPEPVKLTREQLAVIRDATPTYPDYARPSAYFGTPVVLVDTPEESTLGAAYSQVASEEPQVAAERGWLSRVLTRMFGRSS